MSTPLTSVDLAGLAKSSDLECKAAQGREERGEVPEVFWKSYRVMANADNGEILLGIQEKPRGTFQVLGLGEGEARLQRSRNGLQGGLPGTPGSQNRQMPDRPVGTTRQQLASRARRTSGARRHTSRAGCHTSRAWRRSSGDTGLPGVGRRASGAAKPAHPGTAA